MPQPPRVAFPVLFGWSATPAVYTTERSSLDVWGAVRDTELRVLALLPLMTGQTAAEADAETVGSKGGRLNGCDYR